MESAIVPVNFVNKSITMIYLAFNKELQFDRLHLRTFFALPWPYLKL